MGYRRQAGRPGRRGSRGVTVRIVPRRPHATYREAQWRWLARVARSGKLPKGNTLLQVAAKFHTSKDTVAKQLRHLRTTDPAAPLPPWLAVRGLPLAENP